MLSSFAYIARCCFEETAGIGLGNKKARYVRADGINMTRFSKQRNCMKNLLISIAVLTSCAAFAQEPSYTPQQQDHCMKVAQAFQMVATGRDSNWPPATALHTITASPAAGISDAEGKRIVNLVYADPDFVNAGGPALANQIYQACLYPHGKPKPFQ
jgi:hypothetical protein